MSLKNRRASLQPAYVLHRRPFRDTSYILELLSPSYGRLGAVARKANNQRSGTAALLQPFQPLLLSWSGAGELVTLGSVEAQGRPLRLFGQSQFCGLYLNELLLRCIHPHDPQIELFGLYDTTLRKLSETVENPTLQVLLRDFELKLLDLLGYGLLTSTDAKGREIKPGAYYDYQLDFGAVLIPNQEIQAAEIHGLRVSGETLQCLDKGILDEAKSGVLKQAKQLMRYALARHLGSKPLNSRELLRSLVNGV